MWRESGLKGASLGAAFAVLFFVCLAEYLFPAFAADRQEETNILVSSSPPSSSVRFIQGVEDGVLSLEKDVTFKVKAYVAPVTVPEETIYAQRELSIPEKEFVCPKWPCTRKWEFDFSDKPVSIADFSGLQIIWSQSVFGATPEISVDAKIKPDGGDRDPVVLKGHFSEKDEPVLRPVKTIDIKAAEYVEKSTAYLARRELGFEADERWRYDQDGENLVLQARVDLALKEVQAVQVFFDPKQPIEAVQFSVDTDGNGRRDIFILDGQTKHNVHKEGNRSVLTFDLRGAIKNLGIDPEKGVLQEPIVFLPTNFPSYKRDMPIKKIVFASIEHAEDEEIIRPKVEHRGGQYSLAFNFSDAVEGLSIWNGHLDNLSITARLNGPQAIRWDKVRLFDTWETQVPVLAKEPEKVFKEWVTPEEREESVFGPLERIKSFRPLLVQSFRETLSRVQQSFRDTFFVLPQGKNTVPGSDGRSQKEGRGGRRGYPTDEDVESVLLRFEDDMVRGRLYSFISGAMDNSVVQCEMTIEDQGKTKKVPVNLLPGFKRLTPTIQNGARVRDLEIRPPVYINQGALDLNVVLFDVRTSSSGVTADNKNAEWWMKGQEVPLSLQGGRSSLDDKGKQVFLLQEGHGENRYSYVLDVSKENSILPLEFILPGKLPQPCAATLKINGRNTAIPYGPFTLPLSSFGPISGEVEFAVEYLGDKKIIEIPVPRIKFLGLRRTAKDEVKNLGLQIDGKKNGLTVPRVPPAEGEWIDMGSVVVEKGEHAIQVEENPYFRIKTLLLETDTLLPWPQKEEEEGEATPFWKKMVLLGVKFLVVAGLLFVIYLSRSRIGAFLGYVFRPIRNLLSKTYWRLPNLAWTIIWAMLGVGLYGVGLMDRSSGENYGFTFGGIALVLVIWHLSRVLRDRISRRFPKAAEYIYRSRGTPFFAWAIALLVVTALLLVIELEPVAEQVAVIVYYLLVVGVVGELVSLRRREGAPEGGQKSEV